MNIRKMLRQQAENLASNKDVGKRNDAVEVLISTLFKDGHIHHHVPREEVAKLITEDLLGNINIDLASRFTSKDQKQPPKEVIFKNRQAIGDILTFTAGVRDFKNQYPDTRVGVISTAMHVWDNNPYIDHQFKDPEAIVEVGPKYLTDKSNMWNYHLCNAFRMKMEIELGVPIMQGETRPDIWMTEEEINRPPIIKGPYWLIIIGGEPGWTAKMYPADRWQEVVNSLPEIQFVQLGMARHPYAHLDNVIDFIGKTEDRNTGIRDLFNIFYHAQGSVGLVSMHMHLSAAFDNPCVVGDTLITTEYGLQFPVNLIDKKFKAMVDGSIYNSNGFWKTGSKRVIQLNFKSGREIKVTRKHEIMTENGWKEAKDIKIGEKVRINNHRKYNFNVSSNNIYYEDRRDYARGYLLGNFLSDGCLGRKTAIMMWYDKDRIKYRDDAFMLMEEAGWGLSKRYMAEDNGVVARIYSTNLYDFAIEKGCIMEDKKIFTKRGLIGSWSYLSGLVAGYFDGDGTVGNYKKNMSASISSIKLNNLKLLQISLNAFGIDSKIYIETKSRLIKFAKKEYNSHPVHRLVISGDNMRMFMKNIPIRNIDKIEKFKDVEFSRKRKARITKFFDILVDVNELEVEDVYDCEVENIHAFDANSIYTHNCVVVAGAREPSWFTHYMGHQYVQTNGTIPECALHRACWKTSLKGCMNHKDGIPKCVDIIRPDEIVNGIRKYYDGGRLQYGKKVKNNFFKNIVKEKKVFVAPKVEEIDNQLLEKYGFQWGGGSITDRDWMFLKELFGKYKVKTVLEFGAGLSTLLFSTAVEKIHTYETIPGWIQKIRNMAPDHSTIYQWDGKSVSNPLDKKYDFAFVDGPAGGANREWSTKYASEHADLVVIHDAGRKEERKWQSKYLEKDFMLAAKGGHRCHFWKRKVSIEVDDSKPLARMVTTCRGYGGSEKSTLHIMRMLVDKGYRVELASTGNICGPYLNDIPDSVQTIDWENLRNPSDLTVIYSSDTIWNWVKQPQWDVMNFLDTKRKVMILNYQLGEAGKVEWSKDWDLYMFLNSTKEMELLERIPDAKTKVLPPPTDLKDYFKLTPKYDSPLRLIRHNSQRDAKHAEYTNTMIRDVLRIDSSIEFHYMPARSDTMDHPNIYKFTVNQLAVPLFLNRGNCFWYHLPPGYQDQGPRVIIEAMASGLPVIADNRYGAKDRVTKETGWLCDEYDEYLDVIEEIVNNPIVLMSKGQAARERAKREFVPERWLEEIIG